MSSLRRAPHKCLGFKRAASTRLKGSTSNNIAAYLSHENKTDVETLDPKPLAFEREESSSESEGRFHKNALAVDFSPQANIFDSNKNFRSSHHRHNRPEPKQTAAHKQASAVSFPRNPMVCSAVPTPALKSLGIPKLLESKL